MLSWRSRFPDDRVTIERVPEVALLLLLVFPLVRTAASPGLRRRFQAFPPIQQILTVGLALYVLVVVLLILFSPVLLRWAAVLAGVILIGEAWQRRSSFGTRRGMPPGSLAVLPAGPWSDPDYYRKTAERFGPVFKFRHLIDPAVAIVGLQRVSEFLRKNEEQLLIPPAPFNAIVPGGFVRYLSGREHLGVAETLRSAVTPRVIDSNADEFRRESRSALDAIAGGAPAAAAIDRMVLAEMMTCFLGVQAGHRFERLEVLFNDADYRQLARHGRASARAAMMQIIDEIRGLPVTGTSSFLSELAGAHPEALQSDEIVGNFAYALHTARIDVSGLLVWVIAVLGANPSWVSRLRDDICERPAEAACNGGLADRIVRETLRLRQSEFLLRRTKAPVEFEGFTIPAGWHVRLCIAESHRAPDVFENPDSFDPERFSRSMSRSRYAPFGFAPHLCPGEHLARVMGRHLVVELALAWDISVSNVEPWEFSGFHWRPSGSMQVALQRRSS